MFWTIRLNQVNRLLSLYVALRLVGIHIETNLEIAPRKVGWSCLASLQEPAEPEEGPRAHCGSYPWQVAAASWEGETWPIWLGIKGLLQIHVLLLWGNQEWMKDPNLIIVGKSGINGDPNFKITLHGSKGGGELYGKARQHRCCVWYGFCAQHGRMAETSSRGVEGTNSTGLKTKHDHQP